EPPYSPNALNSSREERQKKGYTSSTLDGAMCVDMEDIYLVPLTINRMETPKIEKGCHMSKNYEAKVNVNPKLGCTIYETC
ncbi:940_t:CDS:2, partial [Gigaspora rosea]